MPDYFNRPAFSSGSLEYSSKLGLKFSMNTPLNLENYSRESTNGILHWNRMPFWF